MKVFTINKFNQLVNMIDDGNNYDFETFYEGLMDLQEELTDGDIDEIIDFLSEQFGIEHDMDVTNMTNDEAKELCDYINNILENSYGIY